MKLEELMEELGIEYASSDKEFEYEVVTEEHRIKLQSTIKGVRFDHEAEKIVLELE